MNQGILYTAPARCKSTGDLVEDSAADEAMRLVDPIGKAVAGARTHAAVIAALQDVMCAEMGADGFDAIRAVGYLSSSLCMREIDERLTKAGRPLLDPHSPELAKHTIHVLGQVMGILMSQIGVEECTVLAKRRSERRAP